MVLALKTSYDIIKRSSNKTRIRTDRCLFLSSFKLRDGYCFPMIRRRSSWLDCCLSYVEYCVGILILSLGMKFNKAILKLY